MRPNFFSWFFVVKSLTLEEGTEHKKKKKNKDMGSIQIKDKMNQTNIRQRKATITQAVLQKHVIPFYQEICKCDNMSDDLKTSKGLAYLSEIVI